jgi:hypothetical protein
LSTGVLCAGGWLDWLLPFPPPGEGKLGRRSTGPVLAAAVGGFCEYALPEDGPPSSAALAIDRKTMLATRTMTIASMNTL